MKNSWLTPEQQLVFKRMDPISNSTRPAIVALNTAALELYPSGSLYWRHFSPLRRDGVFDVYGTQSFRNEHLDDLVYQINAVYPDLHVTKTIWHGQDLWGFSIDLRSLKDDEIISFFADLPTYLQQ